MRLKKLRIAVGIGIVVFLVIALVIIFRII